MAGVKTLSEILGAPADDDDKLSEELHDRDGNVSRLRFALLTTLRTSFVNPLPREDMFQLSLYLVHTFRTPRRRRRADRPEPGQAPVRPGLRAAGSDWRGCRS